MEKNNKSIIESVLYVSGDEGIKVADLKKVLDLATDDIRKLLNEMKKEMDNDPNRGITIECFEDTYHLLTKKENHDELTKLFDIKIKNPLTSSMLETLAIIAYNMPCPTSKVEQIRGHNAINTIQKLLKLELIKNLGRSNMPGRPYVYEVTNKFYDTFGIKDIKELPQLDEIMKDLMDADENVPSDLDFFDSNQEH